MKPLPILFLLTWAALASTSVAETVKDREASVRKDKEVMEKDTRWIYSDFQKGFAEAKRTGKPLLVVLRCVPCLACAGIDSAVLLQETDLAPLLDKFVCVRVINANALDLSLFQFDYDLSFSTMFFNGDGTIYGRYGSWKHQRDPQDKTTANYKRAIEAALDIHRNYPANKASLAGKQGVAAPYRTPIEIPGLAGKYELGLNWTGKVVQSCVHCHQIGEAFRETFRKSKQPMPSELIYSWPNPEILGLTLAADQIARVEAVAADSAAAKAGLKIGDDILSVEGQPLLSVADLSWALNRAPEAGKIAVVANRDGAPISKEMALARGWRSKADISRRVGTWGMRGMASGGMVLEDLSEPLRAQRELGKDQLALNVKSVGLYGKHAAAKNAGFKKDDVIVALDGQSSRMTEGQLLGYLLQKHFPGEKVKATVLRGEEKVQLMLPMQ